VKRLTVAFLVLSVLIPTVLAQSVESVEQTETRLSLFSGWLKMVKGAERDYKNKNGRYGNVTALFNAHLLGTLVFESGSSPGLASTKAQGNFVPKGTIFQVTVSHHGQHFKALIGDECVSVTTDDSGSDHSGCCRCRPTLLYLPDFQESLDGPIIGVPG